MQRNFEMMSSNMWLIWIVPIILLIIIGIAIYMITHNNKKGIVSESNLALKILNERFAQGEIDAEEYEVKKRNLMKI